MMMFGQKVVKVSSNIFSRNVEIKTELNIFCFLQDHVKQAAGFLYYPIPMLSYSSTSKII